MRKERRWRIRRWMWCLGVLPLPLIGALWFVGGKLIEPFHRNVGSPPAELVGVQAIKFPNGIGTELAGWYWPVTPSRGSVVLLHMNRGDRRQMLPRAHLLHDAGFTTLMIDLQGHGESGGDYVTAGYIERHDARAAVQKIKQLQPDSPVFVIGASLGGAASILASPLDVDGMIVEAVYPTLKEAVSNRIALRLGWGSKLLTPLLLAQLKPRLGFWHHEVSPISKVSKVGCPLLIFAGADDQRTTLEETNALFAAAVEPKDLVVFEGCQHENFFRTSRDLYSAAVLGFLDEIVGAR